MHLSAICVMTTFSAALVTLWCPSPGVGLGMLLRYTHESMQKHIRWLNNHLFPPTPDNPKGPLGQAWVIIWWQRSIHKPKGAPIRPTWLCPLAPKRAVLGYFATSWAKVGCPIVATMH